MEGTFKDTGAAMPEREPGRPVDAEETGGFGELGGFDPFAETAGEPHADPSLDVLEEDEEDDYYLPPTKLNEARTQFETTPVERTPEERTARLFDEMKPFHTILYGILDFCRTPRLSAEVDVEVERLRKNDYLVYSTTSLCNQLFRAGSLKKVGDETDVQPEVITKDGVAYYKPAPVKEIHWQLTDTGLKALESYAPAADLDELFFDKESEYASIYLLLLQMCAQEGGCTAKEMDDAVDGDPLLAEPRLYAAHFFGNLADHDALEWNGSAWVTTELGYQEIGRLEEKQVAERA